ncbi:MAG: hypothetical protein SGPRY_009973, partial [Prymnesium sp.]
DPARRLLPAILLARGSLLLLSLLPLLPAAVVSNDWVAALVAPFARHPEWAGEASRAVGELSRSCLFLHLIHNLEPGYDGEIPSHPTAEANGYRRELLNNSPFAPLLRRMHTPIACPCGIPLSSRRERLLELGSHESAKARLQRVCFGDGVDANAPLLCFMGRVTRQKGVHLLLDCGELASLGADFGVMPSLFEPFGLVREEFFAAGTPLVASSTGGLADRVVPYSEAERTGCGLLFKEHSHTALLTQLVRALQLFSSAEHYAALRTNAHQAASDIRQTAAYWRSELVRLRACMAARTLYERPE